MKFVIDTNILFSAMIKKSITRKVILSDVFDLYVPEYLFEEIDNHKDSILDKALALTLNCQIWSNDGHFKQQNLVGVYATKEILELLRW